jgi:hypothetical protein
VGVERQRARRQRARPLLDRAEEGVADVDQAPRR